MKSVPNWRRVTDLAATTVILAMFCQVTGCGEAVPAGPLTSKSLVIVPPPYQLSSRSISEDGMHVELVVDIGDRKDWAALESNPALGAEMLTLVRVPEDSQGPALPVLGEHSFCSPTLRFTPSFPLLAGERYEGRFTSAPLAAIAGKATVEQRVQINTSTANAKNAEPAVPPSVVSITPTTDLLPSNHLKFYITFSEPMRQGGIFQFFRLLNLSTGKEDQGSFRETELWSADGKRLTLWFHPGRQKEGVNLNVEEGPILVESNRYELIISREWKSQSGVPFVADIKKQFQAVPVDRAQPDIASWKIALKGADPQRRLVVSLGEPLDAALLRSELHVENAAGQRIPGEITLEDEERTWSFLPKSPWSPGTYRLVIGTVLEDLAGNSIARPFEVDLSQAQGAEVLPTVSREFEVK